MPSVNITINQLLDINKKGNQEPVTISTPLGNLMIEIQGDLQFPHKKVNGVPELETRFIEHEGSELVRFGILSYDLETKSVTLFIGSKQRLMGSIVKVDPPLGILKFDKSSGTVSLRDVIRYKIIFKDRPLPIM